MQEQLYHIDIQLNKVVKNPFRPYRQVPVLQGNRVKLS